MAIRYFKLNPGELSVFKKQFNSTIQFAPDHYYKNVERFRRYGIMTKCLKTNIWNVSRRIPFVQSSDYNNYLGNVVREYSPIYEDHVNQLSFQNLINNFYYPRKNTKVIHKKYHEPTVYAHCIRVKANSLDPVEITPEKMHKDGYSRVAIACIDKKNITGAVTTISRDKNSRKILQQIILQPGDVLSFDDKEYWHGTSPIIPKFPDNLENSYRDVIILTTHDRIKN